MSESTTLREWIAQAKHMVFFGGAGVSTESGIPDFRSAAGLYAQQAAVSPETILSHGYFMAHTASFYAFYRQHMLFPSAQPNAAHRKLAQWEGEGKLQAVITQNIDGLHQAAGSGNVIELHGSVQRNHCMQCNRAYPLSRILESEGIPRCECGGIIKPDVVLYEEALRDEDLDNALRALRSADVLLVGGTSLSVYPAAGLLRYFSGDHLILINRDATPVDRTADLCLHASIAQTLGDLP